MPAAISLRRTGRLSLAGPSVATIFVRRPTGAWKPAAADFGISSPSVPAPDQCHELALASALLAVHGPGVAAGATKRPGPSLAHPGRSVAPENPQDRSP